jgi:drug/metabolite transporter (DMT)-like permease
MAETILPLTSPPQSETERHIVGYVLAGVGAILFSMKAIIIKIAYGTGAAPAVDAITLLSLRMAFSLPVYFGIGLWSWKVRRTKGRPLPNLKQMIIIGAIGTLGYYVASYCDFVALSFITAQFERLILFTYPIFVMVLGAMFFGGRITRWGVIALCLSYAGIAFIYAKGEIATGRHLPLGVGLMLVTALSFSLYQLFAKRWLNMIGSRVFTCIAMSGAGLAALTHFSIQTVANGSLAALHIPLDIIWIGVALALFSTILPSFMLNAALERVGPQAVSMIGTVSPVATIIMAIVILGEPFALSDAAGTALVLLGVGLFTVKNARR